MIKPMGLRSTLCLTAMLMLSVNTAIAYSAEASDLSKRLLMFQGYILSAYYNDQYIEVKRLDVSSESFYGYGWLDDDRVFVAYQSGGAEAFAKMEVVDLRHNRTTELRGIGGVGDSNFDVNPVTGNIIYNTGSEINLIKINEKANSYHIEPVRKSINCWGVFWIDSKTIGCKLMSKDGKSSFVKYSVP